MTDNGWAVVGGLVKARRERLGLKQEQLAPRGGPGVSTVGKVERGAQASFPLRTQHQLEKALGWRHGTIADVLETVTRGEWGDLGPDWSTDLVEENVPDMADAGEPVRRTVELSDAELLTELTHRVRQYAQAAVASAPSSPRQVVLEELARRGKDAGWLLDASRLDADELAPFLEAGAPLRPRAAKAVERALGWQGGALARSEDVSGSVGFATGLQRSAG